MESSTNLTPPVIATEAPLEKQDVAMQPNPSSSKKIIFVVALIALVIGGAFAGASTLGKIKGAVKEFELGGKWASSIEDRKSVV